MRTIICFIFYLWEENKAAALFIGKTDIKGTTILMMEALCCSGLARIIEKAMIAAGKNIPVEKVI